MDKQPTPASVEEITKEVQKIIEQNIAIGELDPPFKIGMKFLKAGIVAYVQSYSSHQLEGLKEKVVTTPWEIVVEAKEKYCQHLECQLNELRKQNDHYRIETGELYYGLEQTTDKINKLQSQLLQKETEVKELKERCISWAGKDDNEQSEKEAANHELLKTTKEREYWKALAEAAGKVCGFVDVVFKDRNEYKTWQALKNQKQIT